MVPQIMISKEISIMTYNVENFFDSMDDPQKDDKAFLPLSKKDSKHSSECKKIKVDKWRNECLYLDWTKDRVLAKASNISKMVLSYNQNGPDILALQEVENLNALMEIKKKLQPYGYKFHYLIEGSDYRGIDNAIISKIPIINATSHLIEFPENYLGRDTRPILEVELKYLDSSLMVYNVHFPAPYLDSELRRTAFETLELLVEAHNYPVIALGDFNVTNEENKELNIFRNLQKNWHIAHLSCESCNGTYYYAPENNWSFLDAIMVFKGRGINLEPRSIAVLINELNADENSRPKSFNEKTLEGISDHFPLVVKIQTM
tara:strand:- start:24133 stop:25086 length:954 start_codon:yes stop_codon:yes gene_type:complete